MPYMAPSVTHQPELLLLHWMLETLHTPVSSILQHPIVNDPVPGPSSFTDRNAYRLFLRTVDSGHHSGCGCGNVRRRCGDRLECGLLKGDGCILPLFVEIGVFFRPPIWGR